MSNNTDAFGTEPSRTLCGCWNAVSTHPGLDLREDPTHGWPEHDKHVVAYQAGYPVLAEQRAGAAGQSAGGRA